MTRRTKKSAEQHKATGPLYPVDAETSGNTVPRRLYHYTTWAGLFGIISTRTLHLSHAKFLNDKMETLHGHEFVCSSLERMLELETESQKRPLTKVKTDWENDFRDFNVFVSALSERGDSLEQWRAYAPQGGCSIGFSPKEIRLAAHRKKYWMLPCLYAGLEKRKRISNILKSHENEFDDASSDGLEAFSDDVCSDLMIEVSRFKHFAFRSEREWRLFMFDTALDTTDDIGFSVKASGLVPRLSLPFPVKCIETLVLSPYSSDESQFGVEFFLDQHGFGHVEVSRSRVPLRL